VGGQIEGGPHTRRNSYIAWGIGVFVFLVLELLGLERRAHPILTKNIPWFTLSETDWALLRVLPKPLRVVVQVLLVIFGASLGLHLAVGTPLLP